MEYPGPIQATEAGPADAGINRPGINAAKPPSCAGKGVVRPGNH